MKLLAFTILFAVLTSAVVARTGYTQTWFRHAYAHSS
jgi:hypothetical protein